MGRLVAAAVDHVSEIALFWMCLLDACLYLQIVNTDLNKKKKKKKDTDVLPPIWIKKGEEYDRYLHTLL